MLSSRNFWGTLFGNIYEFYDFIVYAFLATYLAKLFFPSTDGMLGLLSAFGVFASGYITRPIGSLLFGYIGDCYSRKRALLYSISIITLATVAIGLLPTYHHVGVLAPILLIICRLLQGLAVSGEEAGAAVYLSEKISPDRKGLVGASILGSAYFGVLIGSSTIALLHYLFSDEQILSYAWRFPFLFSLVLGLLAIKFRLGYEVDESTKRQNPIIPIFKQHFNLLAYLICMCASLCIPIYLATVFLPNYLQTVLEFNARTATMMSIFQLLMLSFGVPIFGRLSDFIGYQQTFIIGCLALIGGAYPIFYLMSAQSLFMVTMAMIALGLCIFMIAGPIFALLVDAFETSVRYTAVSFVFNTAMSIFGATAPLFAFWLINHTHMANAPWILVAGSGALGLVGYILAFKRNGESWNRTKALSISKS
jgi:MHS family proline/betaine transporter-like MFS transporter